MAGWKEFSLFHVLGFLTFIVTGLVVNLVQLTMYVILVLLMGNRRLFRSFNYYCVYIIYGQLLFLCDWWSGARLYYYCDQQLLAATGSESALCIMNHHYEVDWLYGWMVGDRAGVLGNCRVYIKKMIQYVPIIGWAWCFSDTLFLARDWSQDQSTLDKCLADLQDYPSPVWILLFPEGTRYTKQKYEASKQFAEEKNLPVLKHHLVPRTKGFTYTLSRLDQNKIGVIYDVTLGCDTQVAPTLTNVLLGRQTTAHLYIRRFNISEVPRDEAGAAEWLSRLYVEKDALLDNFHRTGKFDDQYTGVSLPARPFTLILSVSLNMIVLCGLVKMVFITGLPGLLGLAVTAGLASLGIKKFVSLTEISKSSSYGEKKKA